MHICFKSKVPLSYKTRKETKNTLHNQMETHDLHMCVAQKIWSILKLITSFKVDQTAVTN